MNDRTARHEDVTKNGNIFRVTGPLCGEFTGHRLIPRRWWSLTPSSSLWRHCNGNQWAHYPQETAAFKGCFISTQHDMVRCSFNAEIKLATFITLLSDEMKSITYSFHLISTCILTWPYLKCTFQRNKSKNLIKKVADNFAEHLLSIQPYNDIRHAKMTWLPIYNMYNFMLFTFILPLKKK